MEVLVTLPKPIKREHTRGRMLELHKIMPLAWEATLDGEPVAHIINQVTLP